MADEKPDYKVYRSRPRLLRRRDGASDGPQGLDDLRRPDAPPQERPDYEVQRGGRGPRLPRLPGGPRFPRPGRGRLSPGRVVKWLLLALLGWLALSAALFMLSAQIQRGDLADKVGPQLDSGPYPLTGANTILVLGSDARTEGLAEPGSGGPSRSDSIMLLRIGGGANASLSIPRDTVVEIPGHGSDKINAAYAFGGPALATQTVKQWLGIEVNHVVEVSFKNFPELIDALGGVTYKGGCVHSKINGGRAQRRHHAAAQARRDGDRRPSGARARPHAQEPLQPERGRPHASQAPAAARRGDEGQGHVVRDLHPPAVGVLGGAAGGPLGHGGADAARRRRGFADRRRRQAARAQAHRAERRCRTAAPA